MFCSRFLAGAAGLFLLAACSIDLGGSLGLDGSGKTTAQVVGDEPFAVKVGAATLAQGGNAVDAATAMYFAMSVTYPVVAGLGGGGICVVYDPAHNQSEEFDFLARSEYQITSAGRRAFLDWATSPVGHGRDMRHEFLAKLYFAQHSGLLVSLELIEEQRKVCLGWLADFQARLSNLADEQLFEKILFKYRLFQTQAMLEWLDDSRAEIQAAKMEESISHVQSAA